MSTRAHKTTKRMHQVTARQDMGRAGRAAGLDDRQARHKRNVFDGKPVRLKDIPPGWAPQPDELDDPDAPALRILAEVPLVGGGTFTIELDRVLMDAPPNMKVVHLDGDYLNNMRENLALVLKVPKRSLVA